MRAGVIQLFTLEVDLRATAHLGQALGKVQRARTADEITLEVRQLFLELGVELGFLVLIGQVVDQRH